MKYPQANLPSPSDSTLTLRGAGAASLSWDRGLVFSRTDGDTWNITVNVNTSENSLVEMKVLIDDNTWQIGANVRVALPSPAGRDLSTAMHDAMPTGAKGVSMGAKGVATGSKTVSVGAKATEGSVEIFPFFFSLEGNYAVVPQSFHSDFFDNTRRVIVYTPPGYYENTYRTWPTLIMHDGQNLMNASTSFGGVAWRVDRTVDEQVIAGRVQGMIIVGAYNTPKRIEAYTYSKDKDYGGGDGDEYLDFLEAQVYPYISRNFRASFQQQDLGILGSSLGGLISCYAGWTRSDVYGRAGCMSSSFWWNSEDFNGTVLHKYPSPLSQGHSVTFYLDSGDQGPGKDDEVQTQTVRDHMESEGYVIGDDLWYYLDHGGSHNEASWGKRFWAPMVALYSPETLVVNLD